MKKIRILLLINWHIKYHLVEDKHTQPSDQCFDEKYWFFKYFKHDIEVTVVDTRSIKMIETFEKKYLKIYIVQTLKVLGKLKQYDVVISHGTTSAIFLDFLSRVFKLQLPPHIVIDISSFKQESTKGVVLKLCQFASKKMDYVLFHTQSQQKYFDKFFPWIKNKKQFIPFGVDAEYWKQKRLETLTFREHGREDYIICVGYRRRDWHTLINAYKCSQKKYKLILVGNSEIKVNDDMIEVIPFIPVNELMKYICGAKFSVLPLNNLNFSYGQMTLLQQMALSKPIICADVPPLKYYEAEGLLKYKPNDESDLKLKLNYLFNMNVKELENLGIANFKKCLNEYSEKRMAQSIERTVFKVLGGNSNG